MPWRPVAGRVVRRAARLEKGDGLRAGRLVAKAGDEPRGGEVRLVGAPHAGPHRIAQAAGADAGLRDIGPRGGAAVGAGLLLQVRQREPHRDEGVQARARRELLVHRGAGLDGDEG